MSDFTLSDLIVYNLRMLVLKTKKLSDFVRQGYILFHSIMIDGKKKSFQKTFVLYLEGEFYLYFESSITSVCQESS